MTLTLPGHSPPAVGFEVPLEPLAACHGRVQHQCNTLLRLVTHLQTHGADRPAQEAASAAPGTLGGLVHRLRGDHGLQPRHRLVLECLSVSSQVRPSSPPPGLVYGGDNQSDAGGNRTAARCRRPDRSVTGRRRKCRAGPCAEPSAFQISQRDAQCGASPARRPPLCGMCAARRDEAGNGPGGLPRPLIPTRSSQAACCSRRRSRD